jgi:hypothetical protein
MDDWHCLMLVTQDSHTPTAREVRTWIHALRATFLNLPICRLQVASVVVFRICPLSFKGEWAYVLCCRKVGCFLSQNLGVKINNFLIGCTSFFTIYLYIYLYNFFYMFWSYRTIIRLSYMYIKLSQRNNSWFCMFSTTGSSSDARNLYTSIQFAFKLILDIGHMYNIKS